MGNNVAVSQIDDSQIDDQIVDRGSVNRKSSTAANVALSVDAANRDIVVNGRRATSGPRSPPSTRTASRTAPYSPYSARGRQRSPRANMTPGNPG